MSSLDAGGVMAVTAIRHARSAAGAVLLCPSLRFLSRVLRWRRVVCSTSHVLLERHVV